MTQGTITMEITDVQVDNPEMEQMVGAMKGTNQMIQFDQQHQKVTIDMMGGLVKVRTFQDFDKGTSENYMDMMGQKIKMESQDIEETKKQAKDILGDTKVVYDKSDKKTILGKNCHKASLTVDVEGQTMKMEFYITDEIKVPQAFIQNMGGIELSGTPLQTIMDMGVMKLTYTATDISNEVDPGFFTKPEGDYKQMSAEELKQMGLGGQLGF
ncbi:MAG: hypothetical protein HKN76_21025 [Saprospiraceae bacterium]|nr:hypothetical protein [Saprospiraceae bacterium]